MDVAADVGHLGYHMERVVAHVLGVRGGEAHPHLWHCLGHHSEQLRESDGLSPAFEAVGVDILPQEGHLFESFLLQVAHLAQYALHVA